MRRFVIGLILLLPLVSCHNNSVNDKAIATIYGKNLYQSDLQSVMYEGISYSDSLVRAKAFIDEWIHRQLIIHQAEAALGADELDFSKQLEEYRNSLTIYKYETKIIEQRLDTVVSDEEITRYINGDPTHDFDRETVRQIILNKRKKALLEKMNNSLYNKAVKEKIFVIY